MGLTAGERHNLRVMAEWHRQCAAEIETYGEHCLTATHPEPARTTGHAGPSGGDPTDSTGSAAAGGLDANAWLTAMQTDLRHSLGTAFDAARATVDTLTSIRSRYPVVADPRANRDGSDQCESTWCNRDKGRQGKGRCDWCAEWLADHPTTDGMRRADVPRDVIEARDDRRARKEQRRIEALEAAAELGAESADAFLGAIDAAVAEADAGMKHPVDAP